jgi:hypothetical protein
MKSNVPSSKSVSMPKEEPGAMMISKQREGGRLPDIHKARDDSVETQSEAVKKRDRILGDGVLIDLMKKSDAAIFFFKGNRAIVYASVPFLWFPISVLRLCRTA